MKPFDLFIRNVGRLITADGPIGHGAAATLAPLSQVCVGVTDGLVTFVGPEREVPPGATNDRTSELDAEGSLVTPGLVDPHTHLIFSGERSAEFAMRCAGKTYLEIAAAGGGIRSTVQATRASSEDGLVWAARERLEGLIRQGVTTVEIKSGYGLDVATELRMLRAVRTLQAESAATLVPTLLCAHAVPTEFEGRPADWLDHCVQALLPQVAQEQLARFVDIFVERGSFSAEDARRYLGAARRLGFKTRLHVDQLTPGGGAELAAELGATSADHLEQITPAGIAALKRSGTVAVLAPVSTLFLKVNPYAPGRALADAGVPVALATNFNPGSAMSNNLSLTMGLACLHNGLTPEEAVLGFTRFAAMALADDRRGRVSVGGPADFALFDAQHEGELPYHLGMNLVREVIIAGQRV